MPCTKFHAQPALRNAIGSDSAAKAVVKGGWGKLGNSDSASIPVFHVNDQVSGILYNPKSSP